MAKLTQTSDDGRRPKEVKRATAERYHLKLWIGLLDESAAYLPA
jgi:hypothetical protein